MSPLSVRVPYPLSPFRTPLFIPWMCVRLTVLEALCRNAPQPLIAFIFPCSSFGFDILFAYGLLSGYGATG